MNTAGVSRPETIFDLKAISVALALPVLAWTGVVILVCLFRYPGVVCLTPFAWLLSFQVGREAVRRARSAARLPRLLTGTLAGIYLGAHQGMLFIAVGLWLIRIPPQEMGLAWNLGLAILLAGIPACGLGALIAGMLTLNRLQAAPEASPHGDTCPICGRERPYRARYPLAVCEVCATQVVDEGGRPLRFFDETPTGGFRIINAETGEPRLDPYCWIHGVPCRAEESYQGGVVVSVIR